MKCTLLACLFLIVLAVNEKKTGERKGEKLPTSSEIAARRRECDWNSESRRHDRLFFFFFFLRTSVPSGWNRRCLLVSLRRNVAFANFNEPEWLAAADSTFLRFSPPRRCGDHVALGSFLRRTQFASLRIAGVWSYGSSPRSLIVNMPDKWNQIGLSPILKCSLILNTFYKIKTSSHTHTYMYVDHYRQRITNNKLRYLLKGLILRIAHKMRTATIIEQDQYLAGQFCNKIVTLSPLFLEAFSLKSSLKKALFSYLPCPRKLAIKRAGKRTVSSRPELTIKIPNARPVNPAAFECGETPVVTRWCIAVLLRWNKFDHNPAILPPGQHLFISRPCFLSTHGSRRVHLCSR